MAKPRRMLRCPSCAWRGSPYHFKMKAYGLKRYSAWCAHCDCNFGPLGHFSKKTERQKARKAIRDEQFRA